MMSKIEVIRKGDYLEYLKATEYFIDGKTQDGSYWIGDGAKELGLENKPVDAKAFEHILAGKSPSGNPLTKNANNPLREKLAVECINSAPKSVSMLFAYETPHRREEIYEASKRANAVSMKYLSDHCFIRTGHNGETLERAEGTCIAVFSHASNRELDMQLHHHSILALMAKKPDGSWANLDSNEIMARYQTAGAIYQAELANELRKLDYTIVADDTNDFAFRVAGFTPEQEETFSQGSGNIKQYIAEHNLDPNNPADVQRAAKESRPEKSEPPFQELVQSWKERGEKAGITPETIKQMRLSQNQNVVTVVDSEQVLDAITKTQSVFEESDLIKAVAIEAARNGGMNLADIEKTSDKILKGDAYDLGQHVKKRDRLTADIRAQNNVISMGQAEHQTAFKTRTRVRTLYSSVKAIRQEISLADDFEAATIDTRHNRTHEEVLHAQKRYEAEMSIKIGKPVSMKPEQVACLNHCATAGRQVLINGYSGTGKSFTMGAVRLMEEAAGQKVIGTALAGQAAAGLKEGASIKDGGTLASILLKIGNGKLKADAKTTFIIDEAAMTGADQFRALQLAAPESKIIILGDRLQYQNIERGAWMGGLQDLGFQFAELKDIERQKIDWHKEAVLNLKDGRGAVALEAFRENGLLSVSNGTDDALKQMALDYVNDTTPDIEKSAMASVHRDTRAVNDEIRRLKIERGQLGEDAAIVTFENKSKKVKFLREIRVGDRLRCTDNKAVLGVFNGERVEIQEITRMRSGDTELTVKHDSGKIITFKLSEYNKLDYGYCGTGHSSQGLSKHHAYTFLDQSMMNKQAGYVLASRSKQETKLYMSAADTEGFSDALSQMGRAISKDGSSDWTLDYLTKEQRADFTAEFMNKKLEPMASAEPIAAKPQATQQPAEAIKVQPVAPTAKAPQQAPTMKAAAPRMRM